jgi:FKBP12-rapamycin complex-associated protein
MSGQELLTFFRTAFSVFQGYLSNIDEFLRDIAVNFLEEENGAVRREAAVAVSQLLVRICINPTRNTSTVLLAEIIERLLVLGISDPDPTIRRTVLENLDPRLDSYLADAENLRSLFIALNDEEFAIRELAIVIIGRLALRNPAYVMPSLRRMLIQQLTELEFSGDSRIREESAKLLAASIRSSRQLIEPYVPAILNALIPKLDVSQDPKVRMEVLSALGELTATARDQMNPHVTLLMPIVLDFLQDHASNVRREVALRVLGQLVQNCPRINLIEQYPKLLDLLMEIIKVEKTKPLRHLCLRVFGVMGAIDPYAYKQLLQKTTEEQSTSGEDQEPGASDLAAQLADPSSTTNYYPLVAVHALSTILGDNSLGAYHSKVISVIVQIVKDCMGDQKINLILPVVMPPFLDVMRNADPSLLVLMFQNLSMLVTIVKSKAGLGLRPYLDEVFDIVQDAWQSSLLPHILALIEELSISFGDDFKTYLPTLVPKMLSVLHPDNVDLAPRILRNLEVIGSNLDDYLHLVVPAIVKLISQTESDDVRMLAVTSIARLSRILNVSEFASRIIHPLARLLQSEASMDLKSAAMSAICHLVFQLGTDYATFIPMVNRILTRHQILHTPYEMLVSKLLKNQPLLESDLPSVGADAPYLPGKKSPASMEDQFREAPKQINEAALKKVWGAGQQSTKDDWAEWMRTFSVALVRESPEPAIRFCFELSQEYYPLVRSLFNAAFLSCWNALNKQARAEFIDNLRIALKSPHMPPEILQMWLNAAEFLEHARMSLPIELKELGRLASKCHAYAKALHYKELEFQTARTADNIEALISLNNQLQQPEAADGILRYAQENLSVDLKESWYEKLHRWDEALRVYQSRGAEPDAKAGKMRCLHALGEWDRLLDMCREMWASAESDSVREQIAPWAAAAACNLHAWESLSAYVQFIPADNTEASVFKALHALSRAESADAFAEVRKLIGSSYNTGYYHFFFFFRVPSSNHIFIVV